MKDLTVLTPPLLMAAVVVIAIVAFLRHELGRGRIQSEDEAENPAEPPGPAPDDDADTDAKPAVDEGAAAQLRSAADD